MSNDIKKVENKIDLETENKMRIFANLILDKFFEDKKNHILKFQNKSTEKQNKPEVTFAGK